MCEFKTDKKSSFQVAFLAGVAEVLYILFVVWLMNWLSGYLASLDAERVVWMPMLFITVMVLSVAISGLLIFGYPVYLVTKKELGLAVKSLLVTIFSLMVIFIVALATLSTFFF